MITNVGHMTMKNKSLHLRKWNHKKKEGINLILIYFLESIIIFKFMVISIFLDVLILNVKIKISLNFYRQLVLSSINLIVSSANPL